MAEIDNIERTILARINQAVQFNKNLPISLSIGGVEFNEITGARRYSSSFYKENKPYTDIILQRRNTKVINIAFGPAVLQENMTRLEIVVPGLKYKFIKAINTKIEQMNLQEGDDVPNFFGIIDSRNTKKLIEGTYSVGGPVNYIYENLPKNIKYSYDEDNNLLYLPGNLINITEYSKNMSLYLRLLPLYDDQKYDPEAERGGFKLIYGESPSHGIDGNEIVITEETTSNAVLVEIN